MLMDISSWKSSLQAYGISICEICKMEETEQLRCWWLVTIQQLKFESSTCRYLEVSLIPSLFVPDFFSQLLGREGLGRFCMWYCASVIPLELLVTLLGGKSPSWFLGLHTDRNANDEFRGMVTMESVQTWCHSSRYYMRNPSRLSFGLFYNYWDGKLG